MARGVLADGADIVLYLFIVITGCEYELMRVQFFVASFVMLPGRQLLDSYWKWMLTTAALT